MYILKRLWVIIIIFYSCAPVQRILPPYEEKRILESILRKQKQIKSIAAIVNLKVKNKFSLRAELFYQEPNCFVLLPKNNSGVSPFQMFLNDSVTILFPEEGEYYFDSPGQFQEKLDLKENLDLREIFFILINKTDLETKDEKKYMLDAEKTVIKEIRNVNPLNFWQVKYKNFKKIDDFWFPFKVEIISDTDQQKIRASFVEINLNPDLKNNLCGLKIPDSFKRVDLNYNN